MKLRIPFNRVFFTPNLDSLFQTPHIDRISVEDLDYLKVTKIGTVEEPIFNDCGEIIEYITKPIRELLSYTLDPDETSIALFTIDIPNIEDSAVIEVDAQYTWVNNTGDYNRDYNQDYQVPQIGDYGLDYNADYYANNLREPRTFRYLNTFNIFGYDLGNNTETKNPDFTIYFAINRGDYSPDYGTDYAVKYQTYSDMIVYRRPFTDQIYYYDATSSTYDEIHWTTEHFEETTQCGDVIYKPIGYQHVERNGVLCRSTDVRLFVTKKSYLQIPRTTECGCSCSCGCSKTFTELVEFHENNRWYNRNFKHFPDVSIIPVTCTDDIVIKDKSNEYYIDLSYNDFKTYYRNDELVYPYKTELIYTNVLDVSGNTLNKKQLQSDLLNWNMYANLFNYTPNYYGDVVINATVNHHNYTNEILKTVTRQIVLRSHNGLLFEKGQCNDLHIHNCSLFERKFTQTQLVKHKGKYEFRESIEYTLKSNEKLVIQLKDGVYRYTSIDTINYKTEHFIVVTFCDITKCISKLLQDVLCNCCDCKDTDFTYVNAIVAQMQLLMQMLHSNYIEHYVYEVFTLPELEELYSIQDILNRLNEYCTQCGKLLDCGCK